MAAKKRRQQESGAAKMRRAGKHAILLGVLPDQLDQLRRAAAVEMRPVSAFVLFHALTAARKINRADQADTQHPADQAGTGEVKKR